MHESLSSAQQRAAKFELLALLEERKHRAEGNRLKTYLAYAKQQEFHANGKAFRERLLMAGNQLGKTWSAGFETAMHLTGRYPDNWQGRVFDKQVAGWAAGVTSEVTRDSVQRVLCGRINAIGTGAIPRDAIKDKSMKRGVADAIDTLVIRWGGGGDVQAGESLLGFKSYDQGREKFQAETLDFVWLDEEPDLDIYTESLTRTNATGGLVYMTFTPLKGMSDVVKRFLMDKMPGTVVTTMTIDDAEHYTPEQRAEIIASYPAHEREARTKGIPTLGSGRIYPISEELIKVDPFEIPKHWAQIWLDPAGADRGNVHKPLLGNPGVIFHGQAGVHDGRFTLLAFLDLGVTEFVGAWGGHYLNEFKHLHQAGAANELLGQQLAAHDLALALGQQSAALAKLGHGHAHRKKTKVMRSSDTVKIYSKLLADCLRHDMWRRSVALVSLVAKETSPVCLRWWTGFSCLSSQPRRTPIGPV